MSRKTRAVMVSLYGISNLKRYLDLEVLVGEFELLPPNEAFDSRNYDRRHLIPTDPMYRTYKVLDVHESDYRRIDSLIAKVRDEAELIHTPILVWYDEFINTGDGRSRVPGIVVSSLADKYDTVQLNKFKEMERDNCIDEYNA